MEWNREEGESDYQVFINHRGIDVKKNLASLLYHSLTRVGLRVFLDQKELQTGDSVNSAIIEAINSSLVYIAIFSPGYAHSRWCLEELCLMLQYRDDRTIIPIFYGVHPSDLRHLDSGPYAQDFHNHKHNGRVKEEVVERWRKALKEASEIKGHLFNTEESDQGEFVDRIVYIVLDNVKREPLMVADYPVGLAKAAEDFQKEILSKREVTVTTVVGIVGLGGSGKSTLVKHLYNLIRSQFKKCAFLSEVSNTPLLHLQQCLLHDFFGNYNCTIKHTREGKTMLLSRLGKLPQDPVFIVLDDIDDSEKTQSLLSVKDVLPERSLILVTSRDKDLVLRLVMSPDKNNLQVKLYDIKLLDGKDARELFCHYAFFLSNPPGGFEDLVERFVNICDGFPLALEVLGRQVYGKLDQSFWKSQLDKLQRGLVPGDLVKRVLEDSYSSLDSTEKEIFLDIAHFFVGEDKDLVEKVLKGLDPSGLDCLTTLRQKCLVEFENAEEDRGHKCLVEFKNAEEDRGHKCLVEFENAEEDFYLKQIDKWKKKRGSKIKMHNLVKEFARLKQIEEWEWCTEHWRRRKGSSKINLHDLVKELARQIFSDSKPHRLSYPDHKIMSENPQSRPLYVRGIRSGEERKEIEFLENEGIREFIYPLLDDSIFLSSGLLGDLIRLRWFITPNSIPGISISAYSPLRSLTTSLELYGISHEDLDKIFDDKLLFQFVPIDSPKHDRNRSLTPYDVLGETLNSMFDKQKAYSSPSISLGISGLHHSLNRWFGVLKPKFLNELVLKNVESLFSLPIHFEELENLIHLDLSGCCNLKVLPDSFTELLQLQYLAVADCRHLSIKDLGKISTLEYLNFQGCWLLKQLPRGITAQRSLRYLNLVDTGLLVVPETLAELENLENLLIGGRPELTVLPISLKNLNRLTGLTLATCFPCFRGEDIDKCIRGLQNLPNLERLKIYNFLGRDRLGDDSFGGDQNIEGLCNNYLGRDSFSEEVIDESNRGLYNVPNLKSLQICDDFLDVLERENGFSRVVKISNIWLDWFGYPSIEEQ